MRLLDRYVLGRTKWALAAGTIAALSSSFTLNIQNAAISASLVLGASLIVVYAKIDREGDWNTFAQAGITPLRSISSVVIACAIGCALLAIAGAATFNVGAMFAAVQPAIMAWAVFPIARRLRGEEPWAIALFAMVGYVLAVLALVFVGAINHIAPVVSWIVADLLLWCAGLLLYRREQDRATRV